MCVSLTLNCSSDMTRRWCDPCMSGDRARSWATSRASGRGEPCPSNTAIPTTGARCISWISLAGFKYAMTDEKGHYKNRTEIRKQCTLKNTNFQNCSLPGCAVIGSSALCSIGGRRSMYANTQPPFVPAHREGVLCEPMKK